jgi:TonB family protein
MKNNILLVLFFFLIQIIINGQTQEATTSNGKKVILNANGTWKSTEEATTSDGKKVILNADGTWKYTAGNQVVQTGSVDSKNRGEGTGLGTQGNISYDLGGRGFQSLPKPRYDYQGEGKVVVEVSVDRNGKVIQAIPGSKGSTTIDEYLLKVSKEAALKARFEAKSDAPEVQRGTITYNFILR